MMRDLKNRIAVQIHINAPLGLVWNTWVNPEDIVIWHTASIDWQTIEAENNLWPGGTFCYKMETKDGSHGFYFKGEYNKVIINKQIDYTIGDGRKVMIAFAGSSNYTSIVETFELENVNSIKLQREGWQAILDNFKNYVEQKYAFQVKQRCDKRETV